MAKSQATIIAEIEKYISDNTSYINKAIMSKKVIYSGWYCGVTSNPSSNHSRHSSPENHCFWKASSENIARNIEDYFHKANMQGAGGGGTGNNDVEYVYVFKVTENTDECYYTMY